VLNAIAKNKTKNVGERLTSLAETRKTMIARATRARDYLDWFEITRARETSGVFEDYLKLKERLKSNPHPRKDDISTYLDRMDRIFHREEKKSAFRAPP
jgi:flavin-binding protein dodecin